MDIPICPRARFFSPNAEKPASNIVLSQEKSKGNETQAGYAKDYRVKVENELQKICDTILKLLDQGLIPKATQAESKVFYQKMKDTRRNYGSFFFKIKFYSCNQLYTIINAFFQC